MARCSRSQARSAPVRAREESSDVLDLGYDHGPIRCVPRLKGARSDCRTRTNGAVRYTSLVPTFVYRALVLALTIQLFWMGIAHGCQRDLVQALAHCGACTVHSSAFDRGDSSEDSTANDACPACHMVSLHVDFATEGASVVTDRRAPAALTQPSHVSHPAEGPERPKWVPAA